MSNFDVHVIHSAKPLDELKGLLEECGGYVYAGIIYKSLRRPNPGRGTVTEKEETRKTIVFCPTATVKQLEISYPQYKGRIADYNWGSFPVPNFEQGETWDLHISGVPNDYTAKDAESFVVKSLNCILPERSETGTRNFVVEFATRLRETGEIYGFGHIVFDGSLDRRVVKLCKLILHNTPLSCKTRVQNSPDKRMVTCVWHRPPQPEEMQKAVEGEAPVRRIMMRRARPATIQQIDVSGLGRNNSTPSSLPTWRAGAPAEVPASTSEVTLPTITKDGVVLPQ